MSEEFIQLNLPCKSCLVQATCIYEKGLTEEDFERATLIAIPKIKDKTYHRSLIECWSNLGHQLYCQLTKVDDQGTLIEHGVPTTLAFLLGEMAGLSQWVVNCVSWREGYLHSFDRREIKRKLKNIERVL